MGKKQISIDEKEALREWGYLVWEKSWKELAPVSNSRAQFLKYIYRDFEQLNQSELDRIENAIVAQTKHWRLKKRADGQVIGIPTLSVWYNQGRYDDPFIDESAAALKDRANLSEISQCSIDGCHRDCHGSAYKFCDDHIPFQGAMADRLRDAYKDLNIDKSKPYVDQCREKFKAILNSGNFMGQMPADPEQMSREEQVEALEERAV